LHLKHLNEAGVFESEWEAMKLMAGPIILPITGIVRLRLSDIAPEKIEWLWNNRLAVGKLHLFAGDSDLGKSNTSRDIAARVSTGVEWPDGRAGCAPGNVLIFTAEDGLADTVRPSCEALGADLDRIDVIPVVRTPSRDGELVERGFNLTTDIPQLARALEESSNVKLVILDPVSSYLGGTDSYKNSDMRGILAPVSSLAEKYRVAIIMITHLNKGSGSAKQRITGSIAFEAASRVAYVFTRDPEDKSVRLFMPLKNNLGPEDKGLKYSLEHNGVGVVVNWKGDTDLKPDEVMAQERGDTKQDDVSKVAQACDLIREMCANGPVLSDDIDARGKELGISGRTIYRARKDILKCRAKKTGYGPDSKWWMSL
jgi:putative DNA primase/helicase